jgi:hypothetical protein
MILVSPLQVFLLAIFFISAQARNVSPSGSTHGADVTEPRDSLMGRTPIVNIKGSIRHSYDRGAHTKEKPCSPVSESHVFYNNYQANFSWDDPRLAASLGVPDGTSFGMRPVTKRDGNSHLHKRAPGSSPNDPVFKLPSCLGCIEAQKGNTVTLDDLTESYLRRQITKTPPQLYNKCVFYTSVPPYGGGENTEHLERVALGGSHRHKGLSEIATRYACENDKFTIWHLYPGANDNTNAPEDANLRNFWEVHTPGSWLNFLLEDDKQYIYFERMSRAMAELCGGEIHVMTMRPNILYKYGYIWGGHEYPRLRDRQKAGLANAPTTLWAVDARDWSRKIQLDWATQTEIKKPTNMDGSDNFDSQRSRLEERDTCTSNLDYERPGEDWFG